MELAAIPNGKVTIDRAGITFHEDLTFEEWEFIGQQIAPMSKAIGFIVGDWINYGAPRYGQKYNEAMQATGLAYDTVKKFALVAKSIGLGRRHPNLDFHHHLTVAKIKDPDEQRRWLSLAWDDRMSVQRLRKSINAGRHITRDEHKQGDDPADRGHTTYLSSLNDLRRWIQRETSKAPVSSWDDERRTALKEDFRFVVDFAASL